MKEMLLDPNAVDKAEELRMLGKVVEAAQIAAEEMGVFHPGFSEERILELSKDPEQRAILACLARIYVDSTKTSANHSMNPRNTLSSLNSAAKVINDVYRDLNMKDSLSGISEDHKGREHHFLPEMKRDIAKTAFAAEVLFSGEKAKKLVLFSEELLEETLQQMPDNHPTKPLIGIELQLSRVARKGNIDKERLLNDFYRLISIDYEKNPHRVATVASWLAVWGKKLGDEEIQSDGLSVFGKMIEKYPDWEFMIRNEKSKSRIKFLRGLFFGAVTPVMTTKEDRVNLSANIRGVKL